eukprot:864536_1
MPNKKAKKTWKAKNRRHTKTADTIQTSYNPRQNLNVKVPKALADIIPQTVKESMTSPEVYPYLNKSIAMQHDDKQLIHIDQDNVVVNLDLHETKSNESLYGVMSKTKQQRYKWQIEEK